MPSPRGRDKIANALPPGLATWANAPRLHGGGRGTAGIDWCITNIRGSVSSAFQTRRISLKIASDPLRVVTCWYIELMLVENQRHENFRRLTHLTNKSMSFQRPLLLFVCEVHNSLSNNRVLESSRPRFVLLIRFNLKKGRLRQFLWTWWRVLCNQQSLLSAKKHNENYPGNF